MKNWLNHIDRITEQFTAHFGTLQRDALNWKPQAGTWSIAQNIDHLITTNESYFDVIADLQSGEYHPPFIAGVGFLASFMGNMVLKAVHPDRRKKMKTFSLWEPATSKLPADILDTFVTHQEQLKKAIRDSEILLQRGAKISSPVNKNIVYTLEKAFDIMISHEERHLEQAKELVPFLQVQSSP